LAEVGQTMTRRRSFAFNRLLHAIVKLIESK